MRAGDDPKFLGPDDAGEAHEIADGVFVDASGAAVGKIGKPLELGRDLGEALKLGGREPPVVD
jgi:hypothetical protein